MALDPTEDAPSMPIGRYEVQRILGAGGFGTVYLALDVELNRPVAIKVPRASRVARSGDVEAYLAEARIVASLDHPAIVPIYDFGRTEDGLCFAVSKYIEGSDLAVKAKRTPFTAIAAAHLLAAIADGVHYAHLRGIVHRDIKPHNILIDLREQPYLSDFGLAMKEEDYGKVKSFAGTPAYMSPEQARGEGHLVDGRCDVFSLGVVFYELLTGRRPYDPQQLGLGTAVEPRPPRQIDDSITKEFERICLKALAFRIGDRYSTARDFAEDLRHAMQGIATDSTPPIPAGGLSGSQPVQVSSGSLPKGESVAIVPKGLRSFDHNDADFFLELLPGARDRDHLPESIRFWKTRILESNPNEILRVGLIYGPSGCGKSSFLKAGVLPLLGHDVTRLYVEATPQETEARLLRSLRKECPEVPTNLDLAESLAFVRRDRVGSGRKVLIVLDQFEQWLHARGHAAADELVRAIRQCDGLHLQCLVVVRDDFWMAVTHFLEELEIRPVAGENMAAVDLFSKRHARKVLAAIGQAYGALPSKARDFTAEQQAFVEDSITELASQGLVVPVQLTLFAEMVKELPWNPATLRTLGGIEGVGVAFLSQTFSGPRANPAHRMHQKAAQAVLKSLLSETGGNIKGAMRSHDELLQISGYADHPAEFATLLRILDSELRLITPTDPVGVESTMGSSDRQASERYYHLTHDYLVPSLQEWLTRKQKETIRGRAELILAERAGYWVPRPSPRALPSLAEWAQIELFASKKSKSHPDSHRRLLRGARRYFVLRIAAVCVAIAALVGIGRMEYERSRAHALVTALANASTADAPRIIADIGRVWGWAVPYLRKLYDEAPEGSPEQTRAAMALLPDDPTVQPLLGERLLSASAADYFALRNYLRVHGDPRTLAPPMRTVLTDGSAEGGRRLRAGLVLAGLTTGQPERAEQWTKVADLLAMQLVDEASASPAHLDQWVRAARPLREVLFPKLEQILASPADEVDGYTAALILAQLCGDQPTQLVELVVAAPAERHAPLIGQLRQAGAAGRDALRQAIQAMPADSRWSAERAAALRRVAYSAVDLLDFGDSEPLAAALASADFDLAAYAEDRASHLAKRPEMFLSLLERPDPVLRAAVARCVAGMPHHKIPKEQLEQLTARMIELFRSDPDPGIHAAAEWALRAWGRNDVLKRLQRELAKPEPAATDRWYINPHGLTMVVFRGPRTVEVGSPPEEDHHESDEGLVTREINRDFAISATEVSLDQFLEFHPDYRHRQNAYTPAPEYPVVSLTWHRAAQYCQWLSGQEGISPDQLCYARDRDNMIPVDDALAHRGYRLPTEAEWEYACRAGSRAPFSWGQNPEMARRYAWMNGNSGGRPWPIGTRCPNRFGLFDMDGNVGEWTHDLYRSRRNEGLDLDGQGNHRLDIWLWRRQIFLAELASKWVPFLHFQHAGKDWEEIERAVRGHSAVSLVQHLRAANRAPSKSRSGVSSFTGFRIARTLQSVP